ncbi:hypothetical protein [Nocardiopsis halotolerans]|uniref:hypothetical protein n=1 Tax=Nocardiopsis halotolerans TaxID=124252 RepID=UPI0003476A06|nr:hypothetical protein [Nocardiopsis halotolerans]
MNSESDPEKQSDVEPVDRTAVSREMISQWGWPFVTLVVVAGGMVLGYVLFS